MTHNYQNPTVRVSVVDRVNSQMSEATAIHRSFNRHDDWSTPEDLYLALDKEFHFDHDPCPIGGKMAHFEDWGRRSYVNPPYSSDNIRLFMDRALHQIRVGNTEVVVFLVPSRTGSSWWSEFVMPHASEIRFIRGRLKFGGAPYNAPFDSAIIVFRREEL